MAPPVKGTSRGPRPTGQSRNDQKNPPKQKRSKQKQSRSSSAPRRKRIFEGAVANLRNALISKGIAPDAANRFARVALSQRQGASIGKGGLIHYKGKQYNASDFANNPLIDYITGAKAKAANEAVLKNDPQYRQTMAELALTRDQNLADLEAQRRSALIDFGDPSFVQGDPVLAAAIKANKFGTSQLLDEANTRARQGTLEAANRAGTIFGGGLQSGYNEAQRNFAANQAEATRNFTDLLAQFNAQTANQQQVYDLGSRGALLNAQQALTAAGVLQPETAPNLKFNRFKWWNPPQATDQGTRGGGHAAGGGRGGPTDQGHAPWGGPGRGPVYGSGRPPIVGGGGRGNGIPAPPRPGGGGGIPRPPRPQRIIAPQPAPWKHPLFRRRRRFAPPPPRPR